MCGKPCTRGTPPPALTARRFPRGTPGTLPRYQTTSWRCCSRFQQGTPTLQWRMICECATDRDINVFILLRPRPGGGAPHSATRSCLASTLLHSGRDVERRPSDVWTRRRIFVCRADSHRCGCYASLSTQKVVLSIKDINIPCPPRPGVGRRASSAPHPAHRDTLAPLTYLRRTLR